MVELSVVSFQRSANSALEELALADH